MAILINVFLVLYVIVALLMIFVILMQRPKSEGLGAAFGGGVTDNIFGAQTTNVLTKVTTWLAGIFFLLTFGLSVLHAHRTVASSGLRQQLMKGEPAPAASVIPLQTKGSAAVGAPGTVTNPTPAAAVGAKDSEGLTPADQAVGVTAPAVSPIAQPPVPAPSGSAPPKP